MSRPLQRFREKPQYVVPREVRYMTPRMFLDKGVMYTKFYGSYVDMHGVPRKFSFNVRFSKRSSHRFQYRFIRYVVVRIMEKELPEHKRGEVMSPSETMSRDWRPIRRLLSYEADARYERN